MADDREQMADDECQVADGKCQVADDRGQMADDGCQVADDGCRMADDGCEVRSSGCGDGESGQPMPQAPSDEMSQEDRDYVYGPSRPGSRATMIAGMSGGCEDGEPERSKPTQGECPAPQNVQNDAASLPDSGERRVAPGGCGEGESETVVSPGEPLLVAR